MILVKIPAINALGITEGCEKAPEAIIKELEDYYLSEEGKEVKFNIENVNINKENIEETNINIEEKTREVLQKDFCIFLGGDHNISYAIMKAFSSLHKNAGLIIFDAHADCMHFFKPPTHEDWLRVLVEEGFSASNVILAGCRSIRNEEKKFLNEKHINIFSCKELYDDIARACDEIMEEARKFDALYLSIDIDVVDAAFAPGTGYLEAGGLTSRDLIYLLQRIRLLKNLKAVDIVEINPSKDTNGITAKLGAKIIAELA